MKSLKNIWWGLTHNADGTFSSTKLWQTVGMVVSTIIVIKLTWTGGMSYEILLVYLGATTAARSFQTYLINKGKEPERRSKHYPIDDPEDFRLRGGAKADLGD